jgi:hypothetical protein
MRALSLIVLLSISSYVTDLYNWIPYRYKSLSVKTGKSDVVYQRDGVKIYKNTNFDIMVFNPKNMSFGVSVGKPKDVNFYMNSNFFNKRAIGLVVVDGHRKSGRVNGGGYFYVKNGNPSIGINSCPSGVDYASQSILWGIRNGSPNTSLTKRGHAKVKTYRNIVGKDKNGNVVVIASNSGGVVTIKDVINEGLRMGIVNGVLFDGGSSVDYKYSDNHYSNKFQSLSSTLKKIGGVDEPTTYIYGKLN